MDLKLEDCINKSCPWSGKPVSADSLTIYNDKVAGFCNTGCRDKFDPAVLRVWLLSCNQTELNAFMGPIPHMIAEDWCEAPLPKAFLT